MLPAKVNLYKHLLSLPLLFISSRISNPSCHNLCDSHQPPKHFRSLLGLGLKFCPTPEFTTGRHDITPTFVRFSEDLHTKIQMCHLRFSSTWTPGQLYLRSPDWHPDIINTPPEICHRLYAFEDALQPLFKRRTAPRNLTPPQLRLLKSLTNNKDFIVVPSDKNLGPVILNRDTYVRKCLQNHLLCDTYEQLDEQSAKSFIEDTKNLLSNFLEEHADCISDDDKTYLYRYSDSVVDPFAYFYAMPKVHKKPWHTRPIVSVSGSLLYGLGKWLDRQLQPFLKKLPTFLSSSYDLKQDLDRLTNHTLLPRCSLFTGDIVTMYPSIDIADAFVCIAEHLDSEPDCSYEQEQAILTALHLVMKHNCFRFGDTYWLQKNGTAMGTPPAPSFASLYYGIYELNLYLEFGSSLLYLKRFIDDQFGIWIHHPDPTTDLQNWEAFKARQDSFCSLDWVFSPLSKSVDFLDVTIHLDGPVLFTTLYEKPLNLHLFIPWNSAHAPAVRSSVIISGIFRIFRLVSRRSDQIIHLRKLYQRFLARGYNPRFLRATFQKSFQLWHLRNHTQHLRTPPSELLNPNPAFKPNPTDEFAFFHLQYHPRDPPRRIIQAAWQEHIYRPTITRQKRIFTTSALSTYNGYNWRSTPHRIVRLPVFEPKLDEIRNCDRCTIPINRLIVAYHRPPNLKNILFPRHAESRCPTATPVSHILAVEQQINPQGD